MPLRNVANVGPQTQKQAVAGNCLPPTYIYSFRLFFVPLLQSKLFENSGLQISAIDEVKTSFSNTFSALSDRTLRNS